MINSSFEADTFSVSPGYVSGNFPITGWSALGGHGVNPGAVDLTTFSPFLDNGIIPHEGKVAFMQEDGPMSQRVSGFIPGEVYYVHYYENARNGNVPAVAVTISDGTNTVTVVDQHVVNSVGGFFHVYLNSNPFHEVTSRAFVATAAEMTVAFVKSNPRGGDNTVLIDNVAIVRIQPTRGGPRLTITRQGNQVVISWTPTAAGQQLQAAPSLNGPAINWQTIAGATSPHTLNANTTMRFFRVVE